MLNSYTQSYAPSSDYSLRRSATSSSTASTESQSSSTDKSNTYAKLLTLDSVFYQPNRWHSRYVRKLTTNLSIKDSRQRMNDDSSLSQVNAIASTVCATAPSSNCCQCQCQSSFVSARSPALQESSRRARPTSVYFTNDGVRTSTCHTSSNKPTSKMSIQAAHQFSTIKTIYNDDRKSYEGIVQPLRPMLVQVDFEVLGDVSGVYFMKYAKNMCDQLDVRGWIRVSPRGTVYGQLQGEKEKVDEIALWLRLQGSPKSKISGCEFRNWHLLDCCDFRSFSIRY